MYYSTAIRFTAASVSTIVRYDGNDVRLKTPREQTLSQRYISAAFIPALFDAVEMPYPDHVILPPKFSLPATILAFYIDEAAAVSSQALKRQFRVRLTIDNITYHVSTSFSSATTAQLKSAIVIIGTMMPCDDPKYLAMVAVHGDFIRERRMGAGLKVGCMCFDVTTTASEGGNGGDQHDDE